MVKTKKKIENKIQSNIVVAKSDDGSIQITLTIPFSIIYEKRVKALDELAKDIEVPGFRKGMAPVDKVKEKIPQNQLIEKTLAGLLPSLFSDAVARHNLKPVIYPRFEIISANEGEDWQIRAQTCEINEFEIGNYKDGIKGLSQVTKIWTPDKAKNEDTDKSKLSQSDKEQKIIDYLLSDIKPVTPKILIDEEVNTRLSGLLEKIEKLGLTLDGYLGSIGKTPDSIRTEYEKQAVSTLSLELILNKIAENENVKVDNNEIESALKAASSDPKILEKLDTPEQRRFIESILKKRKVLDYLASLL